MHSEGVFLLVVLPALSLACSGRCSQLHYLPENIRNNALEKRPDIGTNQSGINMAPRVKYRISARHLTSKTYSPPAKPDAYPIVWINSNLYNEDICKVEGSQNPNWGDELDVDYDEGSNTYLKIEVWDETPAATDYVLGHTIVYVKDMLCQGRQIESPLWNNDIGEFHTGTVVVTTTKIENADSICDS